MLNEDEVLNSGFLDPSSSKFMMETSLGSSAFTTPLFSSQFGVEEEDPWGSIAAFDPVDDIRQHLTTTNMSTNAVDEEILEDGITAASVLIGIDLPEIYDRAYIRAHPIGDKVSLESFNSILQLANLSPRTNDQIKSLIVPSTALYVTRNEFNTGIALIACAQKNMEISLLTIYQHRNDLPLPILSNLDSLTIPKQKNMMIPQEQLQQQQQSKKNQAVVDDPWRITNSSSQLPINDSINNSNNNNNIMNDNNNINDINNINRNISNNNNINNNNHINSTNGITTNTMDNTITSASASSTIVATTSPPMPSFPEPKLSATKLDTDNWFNDLDYIKVMTAPEKEGFIFKHVNYIVESQHRSSLVLRRYSDFYWLWEVLLKRYPFRLIPNLPPKKIGGRDDIFLEHRRQGLSIFINCIATHPTLKKDIIVEAFLTEPSEFLAWRRGNPPNVDEEFIRINEHLNQDEIVDYIPRDLDDRLDHLNKSLPQLLNHYQSMYDVMNNMTQLYRSQKKEFEKYSESLNSLGELEKQCYIPGCHACEHVVRGYDSIAKYMKQTGSLLEEESIANIDGIMVRLKRHYDTLQAFKDTMERRNKLAVNQIDTLSKKIFNNRAKVNQHRGVPGLEADVARLDEVIQTDQEKLIFQQRRELFIRYSLTSELTLIHKQQAFISTLYQKYVHEKLSYSRRTIDNWKALEVLVCNMPDLQEFD